MAWKSAAFGVAFVVASLFTSSALAYDRATVYNKATVPATVTVNYAACKHDTFQVPAGNKKGDPGKATAPTRRGGCLITSITGSLVGRSYPVATYSSSGTGYSEFVIRYVGGAASGYQIYSKQELSNQWNDAMSEVTGPANEGFDSTRRGLGGK